MPYVNNNFHIDTAGELIGYAQHTGVDLVAELEAVGFNGVLHDGKKRFGFVVPTVIGLDPLAEPDKWQAELQRSKAGFRTLHLGISTDRLMNPIKVTMSGEYGQLGNDEMPQDRWFMKITFPQETKSYTQHELRAYSWQLPKWQNQHYKKKPNGVPLDAKCVESLPIHPENELSPNARRSVMFMLATFRNAVDSLTKQQSYLYDNSMIGKN